MQPFTFVIISCLFASSALADVAVRLSDNKVINGSLVVINLILSEAVKPTSVKASCLGNPVYLFPADEKLSLMGICPVPYKEEPGKQKVIVQFIEKGERHSVKLPLEIYEGEYPSSEIEVDPKFIEPKPSDVIRAQRDKEELNNIYAKISKTRYWSGPFSLPIESVVTGVFGTKRLFNGKAKSYHSGLDLRAAEGSEIRAAANGKVVLAKDLFYTGNTVLIDHGYGFFTMYAHLSQITAELGQEIKLGETIGLSGSTGRVSGPHLHWATIIGNKRVDPLKVLEILK